jgi:hypothetical protein
MDRSPIAGGIALRSANTDDEDLGMDSLGRTKNGRRGHQQGMRGKTARTRLGGMPQVARQPAHHITADDEQEDALKEGGPPGKKGGRKDDQQGWTLVKSSSRKKKNGPVQLHYSMTFEQTHSDPSTMVLFLLLRVSQTSTTPVLQDTKSPVQPMCRRQGSTENSS